MSFLDPADDELDAAAARRRRVGRVLLKLALVFAAGFAALVAIDIFNHAPIKIRSEKSLVREIETAERELAGIQADRIRREAERRASILELYQQPEVQQALIESQRKTEIALTEAENVYATSLRQKIESVRSQLCRDYQRDCPLIIQESERPGEPAPARLHPSE